MTLPARVKWPESDSLSAHLAPSATATGLRITPSLREGGSRDAAYRQSAKWRRLPPACDGIETESCRRPSCLDALVPSSQPLLVRRSARLGSATSTPLSLLRGPPDTADRLHPASAPIAWAYASERREWA
ncbi:unnamed protein product, partial [Protopolystoma xenopodis]